MASKEHKELANIIKEVHASLRKSSLEVGAENAWREHCKNKNILSKYAESMHKLATTHWEKTCGSEHSEAISRIEWTADLVHSYFLQKCYLSHRLKEYEIAVKMNIEITMEEHFAEPLKLIDVGSCYNPFQKYSFFDVLAVDLCPANMSVYECDFLEVPCGASLKKTAKKINQLPTQHFDIVTFCFLLEYLPSSCLRIKACIKAYDILKPGGILVINTPDSKHVGANGKLMKNWRYTLACIGFSRIKYEKFKHMHCMAFRKSLNKDVAIRWATLHKDTNMEFTLHIPQDFNMKQENQSLPENVHWESTAAAEDFNELPFKDIPYIL
ncbi:S-adenosylmethionine sensor upstream of mTORC1 [Leguminivora glycinivorella]|uniref:S-adenosylmethionine sensor upstream of mTORC1 n=1 Tax=Leguminivora glycinivorella TaxID=1035111 RepID=UPI00200FEA00|nr:S-adenosylmethionine sensor upstream of mTORC1 [Leguminivora glycinivorella]